MRQLTGLCLSSGVASMRQHGASAQAAVPPYLPLCSLDNAIHFGHDALDAVLVLGQGGFG